MRVDGLIEKNEKQLSLFNSKDTEKQENLDKVVDELKQKFGYNSITRAGKLHSEKEIKLKDI
jgi:DNA polymerase-4